MAILRAKITAAVVAIIGGITGAAEAGETDFGGRFEIELHAFPQSPQFPSQLEHWQPSAAIQPELRWRSENEKHVLFLQPFVRVDSQDSERTHADIREAYYRYLSDDDWTLTLGFARIFWGKAESRHLVDIINQADAVEDIDEEDRLGQPMAHLSVNKSWGQLDLFAMTGFRLRTFPGESGRVRLEFPVDHNEPIFESKAKRTAPDVAARYALAAGPVDVAVSVFHGTSREPRYRIDQVEERLFPIYDRITQVGFEGQLTTGPWLVKSEAIVRDGHDQKFFAQVSGVEYTIFGIADSGVDVGLLAEYQYDGRDDSVFAAVNGPETAAPITPFEHAVFLGVRLGFSDVQDGSLLAGATMDPGDGATIINIEGSRRIGANWSADLTARFFPGVETNDILRALQHDGHIVFRLSRYF